MIENRVKQSERLEKVNKTAKKQIDMLRNFNCFVGVIFNLPIVCIDDY